MDVEPKTMVVGTNNVFEVGCGILFNLKIVRQLFIAPKQTWSER